MKSQQRTTDRLAEFVLAAEALRVAGQIAATSPYVDLNDALEEMRAHLADQLLNLALAINGTVH